MITPEILKEFIRQSLSPEFLKDKTVEVYYNGNFRETIHILTHNPFTRNLSILPSYYVIHINGVLYLEKYTDCISCVSVYLADPKALEKIRDFIEKDT